jgi:hypothetical protein
VVLSVLGLFCICLLQYCVSFQSFNVIVVLVIVLVIVEARASMWCPYMHAYPT